MEIKEGNTYRGIINNCLIKITEIKVEHGAFKDTVVAHYIDLKSNKKNAAPLSRIEHSGFQLVKEEEEHEKTNL